MPNTPLIYIDLLDNFSFVDSLRSASQNNFEMLSGRDYSYIDKSLEEIFRINLQEVFEGFCEGFVLYEMHNELDMSL